MKLSHPLARCVIAAAIACLCLPAFAQKPQPKSSPVQVAGIVDNVVDHLWEASDVYWHEGDYNRIISLLRVCVEADPSFNDAYSNAAYLLWSLGDTAGADSFLNYGITRTKKPGELYFEYGRHLFMTKRYAAAEPYLAKAVTYPNQQATWYAMLGHSYTRQKKYDKAIKAWENVVERFPRFPSGQVNLDAVRKLKAGSN